MTSYPMMSELKPIQLKVEADLHSLVAFTRERDWTVEEWNLHESDNEFQAGPCVGGLNGIEQELSFSDSAPGGEDSWLGFNLDKVKRI